MLANELYERGEGKWKAAGVRRFAAQNKISGGVDGGKGKEMEEILNSPLNRFPTSNFTGLAHFLSRSFIEEQPVGVRTQINIEKEQSPVFPFPSLSLTLSV